MSLFLSVTVDSKALENFFFLVCMFPQKRKVQFRNFSQVCTCTLLATSSAELSQGIYLKLDNTAVSLEAVRSTDPGAGRRAAEQEAGSTGGFQQQC